MKNAIVNFLRDEEGATAIEYGMIAGLIAAVVIVVVGNIGTRLNALFSAVLAGL